MGPSRSDRRRRTHACRWKNPVVGAFALFTLIACGSGGSDSGLFSAGQGGAAGGAATGGTFDYASGGAPFEETSGAGGSNGSIGGSQLNAGGFAGAELGSGGFNSVELDAGNQGGADFGAGGSVFGGASSAGGMSGAGGTPSKCPGTLVCSPLAFGISYCATINGLPPLCQSDAYCTQYGTTCTQSAYGNACLVLC